MTRRLAVWLCIGLAVLAAAGCCKRRHLDDDDGTTPIAKELPALVVRDETPELLMTWLDAKGDHHVVQHPADVPIEGRDAVRVYVVGKEPGTGELFYVADLRVKNPDGTYPVHTMARSEWEAMAEQRRDKKMSEARPRAAQPEASSTPPAAPSRAPVIVYGASWCGACQQAMQYLRKRGVPAIEKDIEADPSARQEMHQKLARAGVPDRGSIPVIDVRGQILMGYEPHALDQAIAAASKGQAL